MLSIVLLAASILSTAVASQFNYTKAGADWTGLCATGTRQSPLAITMPTWGPEWFDQLETNYTNATTYTAEFTDSMYKVTGLNGTLEIPATSSQTITYTLSELQIHSPSEHTIEGQRYDMEIQLIHAPPAHSSIGVNTTILSLLLEEGEHNPMLDAIINGTSINFYTMIPGANITTYFMYYGSMTSPPCTEAVNWVIDGDIFTADAQQLEYFKKKWEMNSTFASGKGNNRVTQDLKKREVLYFHYEEFSSALILSLVLSFIFA